MRVRCAGSIGKPLLQFAKGIERLIVLVMHQMKICHRKKCLLQPRTAGSGLPQFVDDAIEVLILVRRPRHFSEDVQPVRALFRSGSRQRCEFRFRLAIPACTVQRISQVKLGSSTRVRGGILRQIAILIDRVVVTLGLHQQIGACLLLCRHGLWN